MTVPKVCVALLLTAFLAASPASAACGRKITVQNLSGRDLWLTLEPLANSPHLFGGAGYMLRHGTHAEFPVCYWTGRLRAPDAPTAEFHVGPDGGAWYMAPVAQSASPVRVSVTPHTDRAHGALQGHCPAVGCADRGQCFQSAVPGGNCANVDELKIIYYASSPPPS